jgi:glycosyltransferase involved in cell wall biosynthesis
MKILIAHNRYRSGTPSGENRVVDQESEALAVLGHEVVRFGRSSDEIGQWSAAKKATLPAQIIWNRQSHRELKAALHQHRPDVVHVHNTFPLLTASVLHACRDARVPVVTTIHNYRLACPGGAFYRNGNLCHDCVHGLPVQSILHGCYRGSRAATVPLALDVTLNRQAWRSLISAYIFISAAQRDLLNVLDLAPDRIFVRHNLIPRLGKQEAARTATVVYAGRLEEVKGIRVLMAAWDRYRAECPEAGLNLVIAGGGCLEDEVATWASSRSSVEMKGTVSRDKCAELISQARAVLLPSVWEEPFGLVAVEAMAAGVPPVAASRGSLTELITPGTDGALFNPADPTALALAIADIDANPGRYEAYGDQARKTYEERFDPQRNVEELLGIYRFAMTHPVYV